MRNVMLLVMGAAFGVALVANCSASPGSLVGDLGQKMEDLLGIDVGVKDASAAPPMTAACDKVRVVTSGTSAYTQTTTTYFAEIDAAGLDPKTSPHINIVSCDYEYFGGNVSPLGVQICGAGATCSDTGYKPDAATLTCQTSNSAYLGASKVLVNCGYKLEQVFTATPTSNSTSGQRAKTVYVSVN